MGFWICLVFLFSVACDVASQVFAMLFQLVRPLLSQRTFGKIEIFNSNSSKWTEVLLNAMTRDQLPIKFGGSNKYRLEWISKLPRDDSTQTRITVGPGGVQHLEFSTKTPNSILTWNFKTHAHDIGYCIKRNSQIIHPHERVDSAKSSLVCEEAGLYIFVLDNSFSRYRSKIVDYDIQIIEEDQQSWTVYSSVCYIILCRIFYGPWTISHVW